MGEAALADPTGVGALTCVQSLVLVEGATVHEVLAAVVAAERTLLSVCVHVLVDVGLLRESFVTQWALERLLPCKHSNNPVSITGKKENFSPVNIPTIQSASQKEQKREFLPCKHSNN